MSLLNTRVSAIHCLLALVTLGGHAARADSLSVVTSAAAQAANDFVHWSKLGPDSTVLPATFNVATDKGATVSVNLSGANSITSVVCASVPCGWTGAGFTARDTVLWTSDAGAGANGPVTLRFGSGVSGAGALVQADTPGRFTAQIQAYNGSTLLGSFTVISNNNGDAAYIGVSDQTGPNITSVVFSLTACAGVCTDFAVDTVNLKTSTGSPSVTLSPASLAFGNQTVGTISAAQAVKLTNTGNAALTITSITNTGDYKAPNNCGTSVAAGASCTISVSFAPVVAGTRTGTLSIVDNASNSPQSVSLTGTGVVASPVVSLSPASLTFAPQLLSTTSAAKPVILTNTGNTTLNLTGITAAGDFGQTNNCGTSLAAGAKCTISVTFKPAGIGTRTGTISIGDNAAGSPQKVTLSGTGTQVRLSTASIAFGVTPLRVRSAGANVTLTNVGTTALSVTGIAVGGTNAADFAQTNTCGTSVAAGASCTITITFAPTAIGARTGSISITDNGGGSPQTIALTGTGTQVKLSTTSVGFPITAMGTASAPQSVTLTNVGTTALTISGFAMGGQNPAEFTQTNNCGTTVAAAATCTITLTFKPVGAGLQTATLSITDTGGGSPQTIALSGSGTQLKLSAQSLTYPGTTVGVTSAAQIVTVTNVSSSAIAVTAVALTGTNPGDFSQTNTCGTSIGPAASCAVTLKFKPVAKGTRTANLSLTDAAVGSPQVVRLAGTGL